MKLAFWFLSFIGFTLALVQYNYALDNAYMDKVVQREQRSWIRDMQSFAQAQSYIATNQGGAQFFGHHWEFWLDDIARGYNDL